MKEKENTDNEKEIGDLNNLKNSTHHKPGKN